MSTNSLRLVEKNTVDKSKALDAALTQIERAFGKGSIMKLGQQDVVIKPLGTALQAIPGIAGATELDANRTVLLLDVATLVAESMHGFESLTANEEGRGAPAGGVRAD